MVAISQIIAGLALFGASALAKPLAGKAAVAKPVTVERRAFDPACLIDPAVTQAVTCVLGCLSNISQPSILTSCALECVRGLANEEVVS
jgi:hypothetical protein